MRLLSQNKLTAKLIFKLHRNQKISKILNKKTIFQYQPEKYTQITFISEATGNRTSRLDATTNC